MTTAGPKTSTTRVWYIFIDVVEFTGQERSMEDMVAIITALNAMVKDLLQKNNVAGRKRIILATGDGMCIGLLNSDASTQVKFAFDLREAVRARNTVQEIASRKFELRTALNIFDDFKITDINSKPNLIGHGINTAARIMGLCEPDQIVVSSHMYSDLKKLGEFMKAFSPEKKEELKGEAYRYRRIEMNEEERTWLSEKASEATQSEAPGPNTPDEFKLTDELPDPGRMTRDMQANLETLSSLPAEVGASIDVEKVSKVKWPLPKLLVDDPLDGNEIADNNLRHEVVRGWSWQPSISEPKKKLQIGPPSYSKEFGLKTPFRSFDALVSPNGENFKFTMKLMSTEGKMEAHMVFGEASFTIRNDKGSDGIVLVYMEGGEWYERPLPVNPRPHFEVELKALPIRSNKFHVALLSINKKRVLTKRIPTTFTQRFGVGASGNGGACHMGVSAITIQSAAK